MGESAAAAAAAAKTPDMHELQQQQDYTSKHLSTNPSLSLSAPFHAPATVLLLLLLRCDFTHLVAVHMAHHLEVRPAGRGRITCHP